MGRRKHPGLKPTTEDQLRTVEIRRQIIELRRDFAYSPQVIAEKVGLDVRSVQRHIAAALKEAQLSNKQEAEYWRDLELARLDAMIDKILPLLDDESPLIRTKALALWLSYSESRRKLLGVDAPTVTADIDLSSLNDAQLKALSEGKPIEKVLKMRGDT